MAERRGARLVTQRQLEVAPPPEPPDRPPAPAPTADPSPPAPVRAANEPVPASNQHLLERQLRWQRERAKFEGGHSEADPPP